MQLINIAQLERDLEKLRGEGETLLGSAMKQAEAEERAMTDDEKSPVLAVIEKGNKLKAEIARRRGDQAIADEIDRLTAGLGKPTPHPKARKSLGQQWVESDAFEFFRKGLHHSGSAWRSPTVELFAATLTEDPASGGDLVLPEYQPAILPLPTRRLVIADLIAPGTTTSNAVAYMKETTFTNAADSVAEGALKPESTLIFDAVTDTVRKIAHWLPVTEEMLEDVAQIRSYIDARLRQGVELAEEDQLLNGSGVAPDLLGLRLRPGLAPDITKGVGAAESIADAIFRQIMAIYNSSLAMPDGIAINPAEWSAVLLSKTSGGEYFGAGPFAPSAARQTLWGLPTAVTPVQPAGEAFVGAYRTMAQIFRKGGMRVEASNSHADFFIKNLVAIRAEERLALAVYRPGAFGKVLGLAA